jgi:hypothetical protein
MFQTKFTTTAEAGLNELPRAVEFIPLYNAVNYTGGNIKSSEEKVRKSLKLKVITIL